MALGYETGNWKKISKFEKLRAKDFAILKEYTHYYLCGKIKDGKVLYKECFSKFDIDGVAPTEKPIKHYCKYARK